VTEKPTLVFVSTRFLFPADSGGKIRTTQILRGLKGGAFNIRLLMPCDDELRARYASDIDQVCDTLSGWPPSGTDSPLLFFRKLAWLTDDVPVPVASDRNADAKRCIEESLRSGADVVVFDFPHSAVLAPEKMPCPSVMFTHNIEAEIFKRHWEVGRTPLHRWIWRNQYRKMYRFEKRVLESFDSTIAVSERDCDFFRKEYGIRNCAAIPTGVDTDFFGYRAPDNDGQVAFCGSMDWMANIDGIEFFHDEVWPRVIEAEPDARMKVVGRTPPPALVSRVTARSPEWEFTGFVDDVRDHIPGVAAFVIPLRVGGGTRIKAFEAMAMGAPVVSTSIGIEGLPVEHGTHYLNADTPEDLAVAIVSLLRDRAKRTSIAESARRLVEDQFGFRVAATAFEEICLSAAGQA